MFQTILRNATIIDGTGADSYHGDLAIQDGKIAAIGNLATATAVETIDVEQRCVTPGFIDIHRHGEVAVFTQEPRHFDALHLAQGLTTLIHGNCGLSAVPLSGDETQFQTFCNYLTPITGAIPTQWLGLDVAGYLQRLNVASTVVNHGILVGGGTLRTLVAGFGDAPLTSGQLTAYHRHLEQALSDGAVGVSLGLGYAPECFYTLAQLCQALAPLQNSGRLLTIHLRQEGAGVVSAVEEAIALARHLHTPLQISHLKAIGNRDNTMETMLQRIAHARADGVDVMCDVYPYTAGSTQLLHLLPPEVKAGGIPRVLEMLQDPHACNALRQRMATATDYENIIALVGFENVVVTGYDAAEGKTLTQIAKESDCDGYDALFKTLLDTQCTATMIDFIVREEDMALALQQPYTTVISDATYPTKGKCHPRVYGAYPRLIETYVREKKILTLPQAIHKITALPASRCGLTTKRRLAVGMDADICVFHPENIHETATFAQPNQLAQGMDWVFVGGQKVKD
ncbi:hypothetical protein RFF05_10435 [Bengtsoniella intestinalis]|uniref:N-acyl-D-amino-acid deacylase family protein n=1 Tax=Bengtsoniella intestinalis TaxID=3073143 RepID=UPI00391F8449